MKVIKKDLIKMKDKVRQIMMERKILEEIECPFTIKLHWAFQSEKYLHLVLDYCPGGELFYHLSKHSKFSEEIAKFYFCEVLLAINYLHNETIIFRDLKPENILMDINGHIIITDFGLSKKMPSDSALTNTFCGSPEYMCPEMLVAERKQVGHGRMVDVYSLGALLYEFLTGLPPFYSENRKTLFSRIMF